METQVQEETNEGIGPQLLLDWHLAEERQRSYWSGAVSGVLHLVAAILIIYVVKLPPPKIPTFPEDQIDRKNVTTLIAPPMTLTQRSKNTAPPSKEFNLEGLRAPDNKPRIPVPGAAEQPARPKAFKAPVPSPSPSNTPKPIVPDLPNIDANALRAQSSQPQSPLGLPNMPSPQIATEEKPKVTLDRRGTEFGVPGQTGAGRIPLPKNSVQDAIRGAIRHGGMGMTVGDDAESERLLPSPHSSPMPGRLGSNVQLLSDPMGADFWPYLIKVMTAVRKNWYAVIPESARLGRTGMVQIQFAISRDGSVPKLVIATPSGAEPLDRAAVAAISASNPFPPLPDEYHGGQVRLQLTFKYNVAKN